MIMIHMKKNTMITTAVARQSYVYDLRIWDCSKNTFD